MYELFMYNYILKLALCGKFEYDVALDAILKRFGRVIISWRLTYQPRSVCPSDRVFQGVIGSNSSIMLLTLVQMVKWERAIWGAGFI